MIDPLISHSVLDYQHTPVIFPEVIYYHCNLFRQLIEQEQIIAQLREENQNLQFENQTLKTTLSTVEISIEKLEVELSLLKEERDALITQSSSLKSQNEQLKKENKKLTSQIHLDSHNSSKPPSSDLPWESSNNSNQPIDEDQLEYIKGYYRKKRLQGGRLGHPPANMETFENPNDIFNELPKVCENCGRDLEGLESSGYEKRQTVEVEIKLKVNEYRAHKIECACGHENQGSFPENVTQPVQYGISVLSLVVYLYNFQLIPYARISEFCKDVFGFNISPATIEKANKEIYNRLEEYEKNIYNLLIKMKTIHFDETGLKINKTLHYLHVASTKFLTYYYVHKRRGKEAMNEIGILSRFKGVAVHDALAAYLTYKNCTHAFCHAHTLRELIWVIENTMQSWAVEMIMFLLTAKEYADDARRTGVKSMGKNTAAYLQQEYERILEIGCVENPVLMQKKKKKKGRGRPSNPKETNLLKRFIDNKNEMLRFIWDCQVPFDNNQAENDLRMMKLKQKIGAFRTLMGAKRFARTRGYISTVRKNGKSPYHEIRAAFEGNYYFPHIEID